MNKSSVLMVSAVVLVGLAEKSRACARVKPAFVIKCWRRFGTEI